MDKACSTHGKDEECIPNCTREPEVKRLLEITRPRGKDNIKMDPKNDV
jgi:hypothetical protein